MDSKYDYAISEKAKSLIFDIDQFGWLLVESSDKEKSNKWMDDIKEDIQRLRNNLKDIIRDIDGIEYDAYI